VQSNCILESNTHERINVLVASIKNYDYFESFLLFMPETFSHDGAEPTPKLLEEMRIRGIKLHTYH
jgi:hypothetical protein